MNGFGNVAAILCLVTMVTASAPGYVYEEADRSSNGDVTHYCPSHTVCADIFYFHRTVGANRILTKRRIDQCQCSRGRRCPDDEADNHTLFDTRKHQIVLCEPVSTLPDCRRTQVAEEVHQHDPNVTQFSYTRVNCRCPRHFNPVSGEFQRAVAIHSQGFEVNHVVYRYSCVV